MNRAVVGFVTPVADPSRGRALVLDDALGAPSPSRFFMAVEGEATAPVRLGPGDLVVVDCAAVPRSGQTVVVEADEGFALTTWTPPRGSDDTSAPRLFGVVTHVLARPA